MDEELEAYFKRRLRIACVWRATNARDSFVIGSNFVVADHSFTIIGIAPPGFFGETLRSDPPAIWPPGKQELLLDGQTSLPKSPWSSLDTRSDPFTLPSNIDIVPAQSGVADMKDNYGQSLRILLSVCCLLLLIARADVANLLLPRGMARRSNTALRLAMVCLLTG